MLNRIANRITKYFFPQTTLQNTIPPPVTSSSLIINNPFVHLYHREGDDNIKETVNEINQKVAVAQVNYEQQKQQLKTGTAYLMKCLKSTEKNCDQLYKKVKKIATEHDHAYARQQSAKDSQVQLAMQLPHQATSDNIQDPEKIHQLQLQMFDIREKCWEERAKNQAEISEIYNTLDLAGEELGDRHNIFAEKYHAAKLDIDIATKVVKEHQEHYQDYIHQHAGKK